LIFSRSRVFWYGTRRFKGKEGITPYILNLWTRWSGERATMNTGEENIRRLF
jgi:hypothetical protein